MTKLNFDELINFFWNRDDFSVASYPADARIFKKGDDKNGELYYMHVKANGDLVESIDFYTIKMLHTENGEADSKFVKAFEFDVRDIENCKHLEDVCQNTFNQLIVAEIRYLQQLVTKMNNHNQSSIQ